MRFPLTSILFLLLVTGAAAEPDKPPLWTTAGGKQPPRLYLFWQSGWAPRANPKHLELVPKTPPDLFQYAPTEGLSAGFPHWSMCPAPGEQTLGWSYEKDGPEKAAASPGPRWWTTQEYAARIDEAAKDVQWVLEQTGAHGLAPYVCGSKMQGIPEKRLRYWAFYDHWEEYVRWYGPKPALDPWQWVRLRPDYKIKHLWGFYKPQADGSRIYSGCPNSPFTDYLANFVRIGAANGVRGVFVDNPTCFCICDSCRQQWQAYLRQRFRKD